MSKNQNKYFLTIVLSLILTSVSAKNYYCNPSSTNVQNIGSLTAPWLSLQEALNNNSFEKEDTIILAKGNYGNLHIEGVNENDVTILGNEGSVFNKVYVGQTKPSTNWHLENITIQTADTALSIHKYAKNITINRIKIIGKINSSVGVLIDANNCSIKNSYISNIRNGIISNGMMISINNNVISDFSNTAMSLKVAHSSISRNLIKEYHNLNNSNGEAIVLKSNNTVNTIIESNHIVNFKKNNRKSLGQLVGIKAKGKVSNCRIENNVIITNHKEGINLPCVIRTKILHNTLANPYFGIFLNKGQNIETSICIGSDQNQASSNIVVRNNIANNFVYENATGIADHNLTLPQVLKEYDRLYNNWAKFDFSLAPNAKAINAGITESTTTYDANKASRQAGHFVNIGAYEMGKMDERPQHIQTIASASDREIWSTKKMDWDGQQQIRIGGAGKSYDAVGIFPFLLPIINGGKQIISADFSIYLSKIDNIPNGNIDAYALLPQQTSIVNNTGYYQGNYGQDATARAIQDDFIRAEELTGTCNLNVSGKNSLSNFINTLYANTDCAEDYFFIRLSPDNKDIKDFHRWIFTSSNSKKDKDKPQLTMTIGYPELNNETDQLFTNENRIVASADLFEKGKINLHLFNVDAKEVHVIIKSNDGKVYYSDHINIPNNNNNNNNSTIESFNTKALPSNQYILQYYLNNNTYTQELCVW